MAESRYARDPLLYIQQPRLNSPQAKMQSNYRTSRKENRKVRKVDKEERNVFHDQLMNKARRSKEQERWDLNEAEEAAEVAKAEPLVDQHQHHEMETQNTAFKDLDLRGKIDYLLNKPQHLPPLKCEIRTSESIHHGIIIRFEEPYVYIKSRRHPQPKQIVFDQIVSIRILSL